MSAPSPTSIIPAVLPARVRNSSSSGVISMKILSGPDASASRCRSSQAPVLPDSHITSHVTHPVSPMPSITVTVGGVLVLGSIQKKMMNSIVPRKPVNQNSTGGLDGIFLAGITSAGNRHASRNSAAATTAVSQYCRAPTG